MDIDKYMSEYVIDNGKGPLEPYNVRLGFWLPPDSPFGNMQLKYMKIITRLDEANKNILLCCSMWDRLVHDHYDGYSVHYFSGEIVAYHLRKACDEIITLSWFLWYAITNGQYPQNIKIDCVGAYLSNGNTEFRIFDDFRGVLNTLNDIENAYKHSFINSDVTVVGQLEPCLATLALKYNDLKNPPIFSNVSLKQIISEFNNFFAFAKENLKRDGAEMYKHYMDYQ